MNIVALERSELGARLPRSDRRWEHIKKILKKSPGDRLAAGLLLGVGTDAEEAPPLLGEAIVRELDEKGLVLDFEAFPGDAARPPPLAPLILVLGFPRPIQANRILKDLTSLGVAEIHLTGTELGEKSYAQSSIFKDKDFRSALIEGAEQAGNPRLPAVYTHWSLERCLEFLERGRERRLAALPEVGPSGSDLEGLTPQVVGSRIFLHPYGIQGRMGEARSLEAPVSLAIGSERGWTEAELEKLRLAGFEARSLGGRILKTETASVAAVSLALAGLDLL